MERWRCIELRRHTPYQFLHCGNGASTIKTTCRKWEDLAFWARSWKTSWKNGCSRQLKPVCLWQIHVEQHLIHIVEYLCLLGFPITQDVLRLEAKKFNTANAVVDGWSPGKKWYYGFLKRHSDVSIRTPQYISAKKRDITASNIRAWYTSVSQKTINMILSVKNCPGV